MRVRSWIVPALLVGAVPAWAHCGKCGVGGSGEADAQKHGRMHAHAEMGKPAPDFTLKDLEGKEHKLSDFKGKIVVLEWTNHQCPFVQRHQAKEKTMQKAWAMFKDKPVVWLAVNSSHFSADKVGEIKTWAKDNKIDYPILLDPKGEVGHTYGAKTTPHMFVIDKNGVLAYAGAIDDDAGGSKKTRQNYVEQAVTASLNGSTVAVTKTKPYGCSVKYKK